MEETNLNSPTPTSGTDGKTIAIVSYLTFLGWIIAFVMNSSNKSAIGAYHIRQSLMLFLTGIVLGIAATIIGFIPFIGWIISILLGLVGIVLIVFWVMGIISAVNNEMKPLPIIGEKAQELFKSIA